MCSKMEGNERGRMTVLLEPPVEVVWSEQAGPMRWVEAESWELPPLEEPGFETAYWLAELEAAAAPAPEPVGDWRGGRGLPGGARGGGGAPGPPPPVPPPGGGAPSAAGGGAAGGGGPAGGAG